MNWAWCCIKICPVAIQDKEAIIYTSFADLTLHKRKRNAVTQVLSISKDKIGGVPARAVAIETLEYAVFVLPTTW